MNDDSQGTARPRGNGLAAASWVMVGEVDPRVAGALLSELAARGIAAYVTPSTGAVGGYLEVRLPTRPVDRLHVDAARRADAEDLLQASGAGDAATAVDEEAAFASIVAGWDEVAAQPVPPWPVSEDDDGTEPPEPWPPAAPPPVQPPRVDVVAEDEHYVPPPPPPVPRPRPATLAGLLALVGGFALLVWSAFRTDPSSSVQVVGVLAILAGAGVLVGRLRDRNAGGDDGDDGAVV